MINFLDGPAAGKRLALTRIPIFLRVVFRPDDEVDALDLVTDVPHRNEKIVVYRRRDDKPIQKYHLKCSRGTGLKSGVYFEAWYSVLEDQPTDEQVRDNRAWQEWATEHAGVT